jgi:murein DD-endopeptidase MepM/ murein hydrolase activator NlpD
MKPDKGEEPQGSDNKWSEKYKIVIFRAEDFSEVKSFHMSLQTAYILCATLLLVLAFLVFLFISYSPVKKIIPGYGDIEANEHFIRLIREVEDLSEEMAAQDQYIAALQSLIKDGIVENTEEPGEFTVSQPGEVSSPRKEVVNANSTESKPKVVQDRGNIYSELSARQLVPPVDGLISSNFEPDLKHYGVDILAPKNTPIRAIMDGFVFNSGWDVETGYSLGIQHEGNILSFYKHNSVLLKEKGTFVRAGEAIAIIGNTGTLSSGPHLHFEMWHEGRPVNPQEFINLN